MSKILWDAVGERFYETGVDHGVLYPMLDNGSYGTGVPWNGLTTVTENPSGAEDSPQWADNMKYLNLKGAEEYGLTVECYTTPEEFDKCDGTLEIADGVSVSQQKRQNFGFCYRTRIGNDVKNDDYGYKLHLVYGCSASPSEKSHSTVNDSPEAATMSYEITTTPVTLEGYRAVSCITIDSTKIDKSKLEELEKKLYGDEDGDATLPTPTEIKDLLAA